MRNHSSSSFALNLTSLVLLLSLSLAMIHSKSEVITLTPDTFTDKVIIIYNLTLFCICFVFHSDIKILRIHGSIMNAILDYGFFFISVVSPSLHRQILCCRLYMMHLHLFEYSRVENFVIFWIPML